MTFNATGGLFVLNFRGALGGGTAINLLATTHKIALFNNTIGTQDYSTAIATSAYNTGVWLTSAEASGTGWVAGGPDLAHAGASSSSTSPTLTDSPAGTLKYDMDDVIQGSVTVTDARGCLIYADASTPKIGIVGIPFGNGYNPSNGTFTIQWATTGVFAIDLTP